MYIGAGIIVLALIVWWFYFRKSSKKGAAEGAPAAAPAGGGKPIIYGSLGCPYTVKQMEKYPDHEFVDCTSGKCPSFVTAYPTTKWPDGKIDVGFS
jgi:hypothetical protein